MKLQLIPTPLSYSCYMYSNLKSKSIQQSTQLASLIGHTATFWIFTWVGLIRLCERFFSFFSRFLKKIEKSTFLTSFEFTIYVFHNPAYEGIAPTTQCLSCWWNRIMSPPVLCVLFPYIEEYRNVMLNMTCSVVCELLCWVEV